MGGGTGAVDKAGPPQQVPDNTRPTMERGEEQGSGFNWANGPQDKRHMQTGSEGIIQIQ